MDELDVGQKSKMFFPIGIIFLVVFLILIGFGLAAGLFVFTLAAVAVGLGITSTSVACGFIQKRPSTGFRTFFYQFFIIAFVPAGVLTTWLISLFCDFQLTAILILSIGISSGAAIGLLFGMLHSLIIDQISLGLVRLFSKT